LRQNEERKRADAVPDDFAVRPDMVRLAPGAAATLRYFVEFR